jgi:hypothetical protein
MSSEVADVEGFIPAKAHNKNRGQIEHLRKDKREIPLIGLRFWMISICRR